MAIYTAINIGPIVSTIQMARKPRELWSASYMFSHLMKCIIEELLKTINKDDIISPATFNPNEKNGVGLYPDRVFIKGEVSYNIIKPTIEKFAEDLSLDKDYFNVMVISDDYSSESLAIAGLNKKLDCMELLNRTITSECESDIRKLLQKKYNSSLFDFGFEKGKFKILTLAEYATAELSKKNEKNWVLSRKIEKDYEKLNKNLPDEYKIVIEDDFYTNIKDFFVNDFKSYHKYFCVIQADGDNVGKTVSHKQLEDGKVKEISEKLLEFGKNAKKAIDDFGGLPIYAGGDDLLFIAPVVGKDGTSIFALLDKLNDDSFKGVKGIIDPLKLKDDKDKEIKASLSFGVSVNYYKYPLYEALENARHLLFDVAKHVNDKNAIAVDWRKHSGGAFSFSFSKNKPNSENKSDLSKAFEKMIAASAVEESIVSAVAHKIRENEGLLELWFKENDAAGRNLNFFKKYMDYDPDKKNKCNDDNYKESAMNLLTEIFKIENKDISKAVQTMYGMLRTAKFINGEEVKDE